MLRTLSSAFATGQPATIRLRVEAACAHLALSALVAALAFALVHFVWYPKEFWQMAGGRELFFLVVSVDVVLGPLVTLAIFNPGKGRARLAFDLWVVGLLQLCALLYGLWTVSAARPVYMVFTGDRFNLVTSVMLDPVDIAKAERPEFKHLSWFGPKIIGTRAARDNDEKLALVADAMAGKDVELQPKMYLPIDLLIGKIGEVAQPLPALRKKNAAAGSLGLLDDAIRSLNRPEESLRWLPVIARGDWVVLLDASSSRPLAYVPLNGF